MGQLDDKVAVVTGASRGIGEAIARTFAAEGAQVALVARSDDDLERVAQDIKAARGYGVAMSTDITQEGQVQSLARRVVETLGRVDILVNNAGLMFEKPLHEFTTDEWDKLFDLNVKAAFLCTRAVLKNMMDRKGGIIINVSSMAGLATRLGSVPYAASKWALVGFSRDLALELRPYNIAVGCLCPGATNSYIRGEPSNNPEWMQAKEVAAAALFMAIQRPGMTVHEISLSPISEGL